MSTAQVVAKLTLQLPRAVVPIHSIWYTVPSSARPTVSTSSATACVVMVAAENPIAATTTPIWRLRLVNTLSPRPRSKNSFRLRQVS